MRTAGSEGRWGGSSGGEGVEASSRHGLSVPTGRRPAPRGERRNGGHRCRDRPLPRARRALRGHAARVRVRPALVLCVARSARADPRRGRRPRPLGLGRSARQRPRPARSDVDLTPAGSGSLVPALHVRPGGGTRGIALAEPIATPSGCPEVGRDRGAARAGRGRLPARVAQPRAPRAPLLGGLA